MEDKYMIGKIIDEKSRIIAVLTLIILGVICRILLKGVMMDLFFVIAVVSILGGLLLGGYYTFIVPISIMIITDLIIGNNIIFLFTWSGFVILAVIGYLLKSKQYLTIKKAPIIIGSGIAGIIIYDIWTNFGCWLGWYPHTFEGLITCYTMAIPFILWHLITTTIALTAVIIPLTLLNKDEDINIKPLKRHTTIAIPVFLMIAAIISLIV
jgi:hypothetical protein